MNIFVKIWRLIFPCKGASLYREMIKEGVQFVKVDGVKHYYRISSDIDFNLYNILTDKEMDDIERRIQFLSCVLCNKRGKRLFDYKVPDDRHVLINIDDEIQIEIVTKAWETLLPKKKLKEAM